MKWWNGKVNEWRALLAKWSEWQMYECARMSVRWDTNYRKEIEIMERDARTRVREARKEREELKTKREWERRSFHRTKDAHVLRSGFVWKVTAIGWGQNGQWAASQWVSGSGWETGESECEWGRKERKKNRTFLVCLCVTVQDATSTNIRHARCSSKKKKSTAVLPGPRCFPCPWFFCFVVGTAWHRPMTAWVNPDHTVSTWLDEPWPKRKEQHNTIQHGCTPYTTKGGDRKTSPEMWKSWHHWDRTLGHLGRWDTETHRGPTHWLCQQTTVTITL